MVYENRTGRDVAELDFPSPPVVTYRNQGMKQICLLRLQTIINASRQGIGRRYGMFIPAQELADRARRGLAKHLVPK